MAEFEVAGDINSFIDLQIFFLEIKCKIFQDTEAELNYDAGAVAEVNRRVALYSCNKVLHLALF